MSKAQEIEAEARCIVEAVEAHGCRIHQVWDGGMAWPELSGSVLIETITCADEVTLRIAQGDKHIGSLYLVWGNEPGVAIADHGANPLLDAISRQVNEEMERRFG